MTAYPLWAACVSQENLASLPDPIDIQPKAIDEKVFIFRCREVVLNIASKVSSICIDNCTKISVVFNGVISSVEVINSNNVQLHLASGLCPSFTIDKTTTCAVVVPDAARRASQGLDVVTSLSSDVLVTVLRDGEEPLDIPIPEQFVSVIGGPGVGAPDTPVATRPASTFLVDR